MMLALLAHAAVNVAEDGTTLSTTFDTIVKVSCLLIFLVEKYAAIELPLSY